MITRFALALLGVYVAFVSGVVHRHTVELSGVSWPWGLVLAIGVTVVVAAAAERLIRLGAAWFAVGWSVVLLAQSLSPNGSFLVAADWLGYAYALLGVGSLAVVIVRSSRADR